MITANKTKTKLEKDGSIHRDNINLEKVSLYRGNNITAIISLFRAASNLEEPHKLVITCIMRFPIL